MNIQPSSARALALWVRAFHPDVYTRLASLAVKSASQPLGQDDIDFPDLTSTDTSDTTATLLDTVDPASLTPIGIDAYLTLPQTTVPQDATDSAASLGPQTAPASTTVSSPSVLSNVGSFLTSSSGLSALTGIATAVINNNTSRNVLQTQVARVSAGLNPAAITYTVNPATGQVTPMLQSSNPLTSYPVTPGLLSQLTPASGTLPLQMSNFVAQYWPWLLLAGALAIAL